MKRRNGFTLVELLVVVGIIAVLISLLLPALGKVRYQAKITACSARMRDIINSVVMYANDNKSNLPPFKNDLGQPNFTMDGASNFNNAFDQTWVIGGVDQGSLMGRMLKTGYLKTTKVYFCPSSIQTIDPRFMNYLFNAHAAYRNSVPPTYYIHPWWKKLDGYGKYDASTIPGKSGNPYRQFRRAILWDPMYGGYDDRNFISHHYGTRRAWNFAYPDGSVRTYHASNYVARQGGNWSRLNDLSNAIQYNLDGGDVDLSRNTWVNKEFSVIPFDPK
ncbi:MAG TPA: type II secretion system protein [Tepidisphaeraceae bacterium]|jgi:prepilin-type N-terminal cleavage/methylation domain-containing protein